MEIHELNSLLICILETCNFTKKIWRRISVPTDNYFAMIF